MSFALTAMVCLIQGADPDPAIPADQYSGPYHLVTKPERTIELSSEFTLSVPEGTCRGWVIQVPEAPQTPFQKDVQTKIVSEGRTIKMSRYLERSPLSRPMLYLESVGPNPRVSFKVIYTVTMWSRVLKPGAAEKPVTQLTETERRKFCQPTRTCNFNDPTVRQWIKTNLLLRNSNETALAFAYRAFKNIRGQMPYNGLPGPDDWSSCSATVNRGNADCGASNLLFEAVLRSNKIPCRVYCGRHALQGISPDGNSHSRSEFYVDGIGWVPTDATMPVKKGDASDNGFLFGMDPGWYFADEMETDLVLKLPEAGDQTLTWLHEYVVPYRSPGVSTWTDITASSKVVCRNLTMIGTSWFANNSVRTK